MENSFSSSLLLSGVLPKGFFYGVNGDSNAPTFDSWGRELTSGVALVIWVIIWGSP